MADVDEPIEMTPAHVSTFGWLRRGDLEDGNQVWEEPNGRCWVFDADAWPNLMAPVRK